MKSPILIAFLLLVCALAAQTPKQAVTGQTAIFRVTATGSAPLAYQWFFIPPGGSLEQAVEIGGANAATYTITPLKAQNSGSYYVRATNPAGGAYSDRIALVVLAPTPTPTPSPSPTPVPLNPPSITSAILEIK